MITIKDLEKKENEIKKVNSLIDKLTERGKMYKEQYNTICADLVALGVDPKNPKVREDMEKEINELTARLDKLLPSDVLSKYAAMSVEEILDQKVMDEIDLRQAF